MTFLSFPIHSLFIPYSFPNDSLGTEQKKEAVGDISIVGLSKIYRSDDKETVAIKEFNLEIKKGELISIVGPSGCGKTTLLRCIAGLEEPTTGTILSGI